MSITIIKEDGDIKLFGSWQEPITIIYDGDKTATLNYVVISDIKVASEVSNAVMIAGLLVNAILASNEKHFKTNNIETIYINEADLSTTETLYSLRKILNWLESDSVVTVNKKERIRYRFTKFAYQNGKLIIRYKPVVW